MAKVYIITEAEMKALEYKMALVKAEKVESLDIPKPNRQALLDLYRRIHFDVFSWVDDVKR